MAKSGRNNRRSTKRVKFETREEAMKALKRALEDGGKILKRAKTMIKKLDAGRGEPQK